MLAAIAALAVLIFIIRLTAPPNLLDQDQERPSSYVLDAVKNGNWLCQRDLEGFITSKPPVWTWISAGATIAYGRINEFTLYLPGALGLFGIACLLFIYGRRYYGADVALIAAVASMLTSAGLKGFGLARTDAVFAFTVTMAAFLAFRAWDLGRGWIWFWLAAAVSTLTKGPLGLLLSLGWLLLAIPLQIRSGGAWKLKGQPWVGIGLFAMITAGWLVWSTWELGPAVTDKLLNQELTKQAVTRSNQHLPGTLFWQPPLYYLGRAAPWSLLAYLGFWRVFRRPAPDTDERKFEVFLLSWFVVGMSAFCLAPHQRADLLWPIMPPAALIAARELHRLTSRFSRRLLYVGFTACVAAMLGGFCVYYYVICGRQPIIRKTAAVKHQAREIERRGGKEFPLSHTDDPMTFQVYLNTRRPRIKYDRAADLLRGPDAAYVATTNYAALTTRRKEGDPEWHVLTIGGPEATLSPVVIVSNRRDLDASGPCAFCFGALAVRYSGTTLLNAGEKEFRFQNSASGDVTVTNEGSEKKKAILTWVAADGQVTKVSRELGPGEIWNLRQGRPRGGNPIRPASRRYSNLDSSGIVSRLKVGAPLRNEF